MTILRKAKATRMRPLALAYIRVSTEEQATEGASLDAQRGALVAEADRRRWDVELVADEGLSGTDLDRRPGITGALRRLDRGEADVLVAVKLDRFSRSTHDFTGLMRRARQHGWSLVALDLGVDTTTPAGNMMANIMATFAEFERDLISQRTRVGMAQRRQEGVHLGRARELSTSVVERIVTERGAGRTLQAIGEGLTADGTPTAHGGARWHASTIRGVLTSTTGRKLAAATA